jgi:ribosomal protein S6--L-glutamate ligase
MPAGKHMIIKSSKELKSLYNELAPGDIFLGTLTYKHLKQSVLIDLLERGISCLPSPLSQTLNNSKAAQALVLKKWMLPHTYAITRRIDLIDTINLYNRQGIGPVVTKEDQLHCGHGIRKWDSVEALYSLVALSRNSYPFVIQPFLENFTDVRVIIVGDYSEAYERYNPHNFRMNIASGGKTRAYELDNNKERFCRQVMRRGKFPFAHLDLHVIDKSEYYLSEISLDGGIKGANLSRKELEQKKQDLLVRMAEAS